MKNSIKKMSLLLCSSLMLSSLIACGDKSSDAEPERKDEDYIDSGYGAKSFGDLAGVWDRTYTTENGLEDVVVEVIDTNGNYYLYDYLGDQFDSDRLGYTVNCFEKGISSKYVYKGASKFIDIYETPMEYTIFKAATDALRYEWVDNRQTYYDVVFKSKFKESDIVLCQ